MGSATNLRSCLDRLSDQFCVACLISQSCALIRSLPLAVLTRLPDFTAPELPKKETKEENKTRN